VLASHLGKIQVEDSLDVESVARASVGLSPAELMNIAKEAGMLALRAGRDRVTAGDLAGGLERAAVGPESTRRLTEAERRIAAYHECGHALATMLLDPKREVRKVSILGNGNGALGYTWGVPLEESHMRSEQEYLAAVKIALAGMAAERVVFGTTTDGSSADLQAVSQLVKHMVFDLGMGGVRYRAEPASEALRQHLDTEMRRLSDTCYAEVESLLETRRSALDTMATALLASDVLSHEDLQRFAAAS
jgi:cell division protease FtsH